MFDARYSGYVRVGGLIAVISMLAAAPSWAGPQVYRGTISTGAQYDLYNIPLLAGQGVIGRLVCEELSPAQRPLDPVLSVYFPGVDPSDTVNASIYNDDGFGGDDNEALLVTAEGSVPTGRISKRALADQILDRVHALISA